MEFKIPIQDEKVKPHQVTTLHMVCALAFIGTGSIIAVYNYTIPGWGIALLLEGLVLTGVTMFRNKWLLTPRNNKLFRVIELISSLVVASYSFYQHWKVPEGIFGVLAACLVFALYWERSGDELLYVIIGEDGVRLPVTSRKRFLDWKEIDNIVLRFGTLSINCVDDRLFQWATHKTDIEPARLTQFSEALVEKHKVEREEDW